jgi:hypothetical protein
MQALASLIGYVLLAATPALAQATTTSATHIPWMWIIVAIIVIGGRWYMNRMRGPRV